MYLCWHLARIRKGNNILPGGSINKVRNILVKVDHWSFSKCRDDHFQNIWSHHLGSSICLTLMESIQNQPIFQAMCYIHPSSSKMNPGPAAKKPGFLPQQRMRIHSCRWGPWSDRQMEQNQSMFPGSKGNRSSSSSGGGSGSSSSGSSRCCCCCCCFFWLFFFCFVVVVVVVFCCCGFLLSPGTWWLLQRRSSHWHYIYLHLSTVGSK